MKKSFFCGLVGGVLAGYFLSEYREEVREVFYETGEKIHDQLSKLGTECPHTKAVDAFNELKIVFKGDQAPAEAIRDYKFNQEKSTEEYFDDTQPCSCCEHDEEKNDEATSTEESDEEDPEEKPLCSESQAGIIANKNTKVCHLTSCRYAPKKAGSAIVFKNVEEAREAGFTFCSRCIK